MSNPFEGLFVQSEINRLLDETSSGPDHEPGHRRGAGRDGWSPALEVFVEDGDLVVRVELPGVKKEEVSVALPDGVLNISGERKDERRSRDVHYYARGFRYGPFLRSVPVPAGTKEEDVVACHEDGVLQVRIKGAGTGEPGWIEIESSGG